VQYFTDLPEILVGFHMLGAALISASVTWVLLAVKHPLASPGPDVMQGSRTAGSDRR